MRKPFVGQIFLERDKLERDNSYLFGGGGEQGEGRGRNQIFAFYKIHRMYMLQIFINF